ncbi:MAG: hypothetical protein JAY74_14820 [Candidatus Thiodiazotropha taylori]|nr:hypothetical protein [Candidatus Thiodiazotropha taylori]
MSPLAEINARLEKYPDLEVLEEVHSISVKPIDSDGFEVWFSDDENEYTVGF